MTKKSYITLCIVAILYIIMAATAILSPHGDNFSAARADTGGKPDLENAANPNQVVVGLNDQFEGIDANVVLTNKTGIKVEYTLLSMPVFSGQPVKYTEGSDTFEFTAIAMSRIIAFSALSVGDTVVLTDSAEKTYTVSAEELTAKDNAYLIYADADEQPLSGDYGHFCVLISEGENAGLYKDIAQISLG